MTLEELKKLMGEGATDEAVQTVLDGLTADIATETGGLKTNQQKLLDQMSKLKINQLPEDFDQVGWDDYINNKSELAAAQQKLDDDALADKGQWDALKLQLNDAHAKALAELTDSSTGTISGLRKALDRELIENSAIKAIEKEKGSSLFLLPHMLKSIKTVEADDGSYNVQVVDGEGNQRFQDDATTAFGVADLVAEFKANDNYSAAFPVDNSGGGGKPNAPGGGKNQANPWKPETKNITAQAAMNRDNPVLAAQMKKQAGG